MKSRRRSFIRALSLVLGLASSGPALAQDTIEQAIGYWLANDDAAAFPALSALAEGGDERAMLFLGAIEPRSLDSAYLAGLDRQTRNRLLRAPGGLSGKSWLGHITSDTALASALLAARDGDPMPTARTRSAACRIRSDPGRFQCGSLVARRYRPCHARSRHAAPLGLVRR